MPEIEVFIPTAKNPARLSNLLANIRTALSCAIPTRVTVAMNGAYLALMNALSDDEHQAVRIIQDAPDGLMGISAANHCFDTLDWHGWIYWLGDDDALLPWGLEHLYSYRDGVSMVVGKTLVVRKDDHIVDPSFQYVGTSTRFREVSGVSCLLKARDFLSLPRPLIRVGDMYPDHEMVGRMEKQFPHIVIPNLVCVLAL